MKTAFQVGGLGFEKLRDAKKRQVVGYDIAAHDHRIHPVAERRRQQGFKMARCGVDVGGIDEFHDSPDGLGIFSGAGLVLAWIHVREKNLCRRRGVTGLFNLD